MSVDWAQPWFAPWRETGEAVAHLRACGRPLHDALNEAAPAPVRFVAARQAPAGVPYERAIFESGRCPVRDGLHDLFNGLCWHAFGRSKSALNRLQALQIRRDGIGATRGPVRDAITVFDENGALLHAPPPLWAALRRREWRQAFVELRPLWEGAQLVVFGHALLEQLTAPRKGLTAHVWCAEAPSGAVRELDGWLAPQMSAQLLARKPFTPLPVLGVPLWWPGNADFSFYDDPLVFRPYRDLKPPRGGLICAPVPPSHPTENQ